MKSSGVLVLGLAATIGMSAFPMLVYSAEKTRTPQEVWDDTCHACHDTGLAPVILGMHITPEKIKETVRNGGMEMLPISSDQVSDAELDALADWVSEHDAPADQ